MTQKGRVLRFPISAHEEVSNKNGRKFARLGKGDSCSLPMNSQGEKVCVASQLGRAMVFSSDEVPVLRAAGKGVTGIKLRPEDAVMACELGVSSLDGPLVITGQGRELVVRERKFGISKRGARGRWFSSVVQ